MRDHRLVLHAGCRAPDGDAPGLSEIPLTASLATAPIVILDSCTACGACLVTCPESALLPAPRQPLVVRARCTSCGECIEICPRGAIVELARS